jgi:hypothetical protein
MSDELNDEPTREDLVQILNDAELLAEEGYQITPKGWMALVLMEMGVDNEDASAVAQKMEDKIFLGGWIYVREEQLKLVDADE